jgi:hypothetical protein
MSRQTEHHSASLDIVEARLGARLAASLNQRTSSVPHDISERLRISRERAVAVARQARAQESAAAPAIVAGAGRSAAWLGGPGRLWMQLASWVPLALLIVGLVLIQQWAEHEQVMAAAEIDAVLLADDLPPSAWTDAGFREYLKAPPP